MDTTETQMAVLYREVSIIQSWIFTQLFVVEEADSVLLEIEVSFIQSVLYRKVPLQFMKEPHLSITENNFLPCW